MYESVLLRHNGSLAKGAYLSRCEPGSLIVRVSRLLLLRLLHQRASDHKDGITLLPESCQEGAEVEEGQGLCRRKQGIEVPELALNAANCEPMLLLAPNPLNRGWCLQRCSE